MGMVDQLHLVNDDYSNASSSFYIAVLLFSVPNMWLLNRFPVAKCLGINLILWGLVSHLLALVFLKASSICHK